MDSSLTSNSTSSTNASMPNVLQQYNYQYNLFTPYYPQNYFYSNMNTNTTSNDQNVPPKDMTIPPPPYDTNTGYYQKTSKQIDDNLSVSSYNPLLVNNNTYQTPDNSGYYGASYQNFYDYSAYQTASYVQENVQCNEPVRTTTPDKPIMNDSGLGISPTLNNQSLEQDSQLKNQAQYSSTIQFTNQQQVTPTSNTNTNNNSFEDNEDEDDETNDSTDNIPAASTKQSKSSAATSTLMKPPKPYLEIIADAILTVPDRMMQLHEIYQYMESKYPYFAQNVNKSWRNSVRHNLSLNECFVKAGRGSNGKGNYWKIHNACENDFIRGNFRRKNFKLLIRSSNSSKQQQQQHQQQQQNSTANIANYNPLNSLSYFNSQLQSFNIENFLNTNQISYNTNSNTHSNHHRSSISSNHRYQPY